MTYYVGTSVYPYSSVVYIEATFPNGLTYTGSGVIVGQNDVLTASHVIHSVADGGLATSITVYPGRDGGNSPYGSYDADWVNYYTVDSDGDGFLTQTESQWDIALLGFDETIGSTTGWFGIDPYATSGFYNVTGYPGVYADGTGPRLTEDYGYIYPDSSTYTWNHYSIEVNSGNSGGPLWYYDSEGLPYTVGVVSTGGWSADVYGYYDEIIAWMNGNDTLLGASSSMVGTSGDDIMSGTENGEILSGASGADSIDGGSGDDIIYGNTEIDTLIGGDGNDTIFGGQNNGPASTGSGNASDGTSKQREGIEIISGGAGDDIIYGNYGSDLIYGGDGADKIFAGQDNDTLYGGGGDDTLYGNRGDDTLVGGDGADLFVVQTNTVSTVTVWDFSVSDDLIQASSSRTSVVDDASGALVTFSNGSTLTLIGVPATSVTDNLFM